MLAFEFQGMAWEDLAARPWEYKCIGCSKDDDEAHLLMCDNCDAEFHTYCLKPSLPDIPLGPWWCPRYVVSSTPEESNHCLAVVGPSQQCPLPFNSPLTLLSSVCVG